MGDFGVMGCGMQGDVIEGCGIGVGSCVLFCMLCGVGVQYVDGFGMIDYDDVFGGCGQ